MRRLVCLLFVVSAFAPGLVAQDIGDHVNLGVFGNFLRVSDRRVDLAGVGGRVSINVMPRVQFEAESSYNFAEDFSQGYSDATGVLVVSRTQARTLDGLFGPKIFTNRGPVRLFGTLKGGFINFNFENSPAVTLQTVQSTFQGLNGVNTFGVFYPGGGAEAIWGPVGVRVDIGDEMFFNSGRHNNLRISIGPTIRF